MIKCQKSSEINDYYAANLWYTVNKLKKKGGTCLNYQQLDCYPGMAGQSQDMEPGNNTGSTMKPQ